MFSSVQIAKDDAPLVVGNSTLEDIVQVLGEPLHPTGTDRHLPGTSFPIKILPPFTFSDIGSAEHLELR